MNTKGKIVNFKLPSTSYERPMTISGETAILHSWIHDNTEKKVNHSRSTSMISDALIRCEKNKKPKIIGIEGSTRSGKTILAKILHSSGSNTELVDVCSLMNNLAERVYLSPVKDLTKAYIVDEAGFVDSKSLLSTVKNLIDKGKVVVLLFQSKKDIDSSILKNMSYFNLSRKHGLTAIET